MIHPSTDKRPRRQQQQKRGLAHREQTNYIYTHTYIYFLRIIL